MSQWKILLTDGLDESAKFTLSAAAQVDDRSGISPEELERIAGNYDAFIIRSRTKITQSVLQTAANLKVIGRAGVGVDNIDLKAAAEKKITVVNTPQASSNSVAELAIAMIFALTRSLPAADRSMKDGSWIKKQLTGSELYGKTLGIIGVGNIGSLVAEKAACLGMKVLACDIRCLDEEIQAFGGIQTEARGICTQSDYITLHIPLTPETKEVIDRSMIQVMKNGVYIVNTARGSVIDETALLEALNAGHVAGAALDVFSIEPPGLTELVAHPHVLATPHIGAQTREAQRRTSQQIIEEVLAALRQEPLRWKVV